jgi:hypothetical protein
MARFQASLHKVQVDKEGEAKIILTVPSDSLHVVLPLATLSGKLLSVEIAADPSN